MLARKISLNQQQSFLICSLETLCHKDRDTFSSGKKCVECSYKVEIPAGMFLYVSHDDYFMSSHRAPDISLSYLFSLHLFLLLGDSSWWCQDIFDVQVHDP